MNEGPVDRILRVALGIVLMVPGLTGVAAGIWLWLAFLFGAILLVTGLVGFCPLYTLFKINTARK
ncbi:MAG: DUF2892 domain-containing protein [Anaerolineales bacterium]|nr:DUF2892 domain-containing protein [Anaerolineales bacterium]